MIKKYFHIIRTIVIIAIIVFAIGIISLKYNVEGETNMPFKLSKISIISTQEGIDKESKDTKWAFNINQNNDIYIYIDKNEGHNKQEAIQSIEINNIQIEAKKKENIQIYKPDKKEEKVIFKNKEENKVEEIKYEGSIESDIKQLKISNQGGLIAFRCSNENIASFNSEDEEVNHNELLKKAGITQEDLNIKIKFDFIIKLENKNEYKTTIELQLPSNNIIENGTTTTELTNSNKFIFKRV